MPLLSYSDEIRSAVLLIHGEKAHSRYFSEDVFKKLKGENKELMIIAGAFLSGNNGGWSSIGQGVVSVTMFFLLLILGLVLGIYIGFRIIRSS